MKAYKFNLINSVTLIALGLWGSYPYLCSPETGSPTSLIPVFFGFILLVLSPGLKKENKIISHIAVLLTFLLFISLFMPLKGAVERSSLSSGLRVSIMLFTSFLSLASFIKSFIHARKNSNKL